MLGSIVERAEKGGVPCDRGAALAGKSSNRNAHCSRFGGIL